MLSRTITLCLLSICATSASAQTREPSPKFIFRPIADAANECSRFGGAWKSRVESALRQARAGTATLLDDSSWDLLLSLPNTLPRVTPTAAQTKECEGFLVHLAGYRKFIRSALVSGQFIQSAAGCEAAFPGSIRSTWIQAFRRNELDPNEQVLDEAAAGSWRRSLVDQQHKAACEEIKKFLRSSEFDASASDKKLQEMIGAMK